MEETMLLPGDILQAKDTLDLGKYYVKSGEQMMVLGSNYNKQNELCVALSTGITNQYDPNSTKAAEIWTIYKIIAPKTELVRTNWNIDGYVLAMADYYNRLRQLSTLSLLEMGSCVFLFNCLNLSYLPVYLIDMTVIAYLLVMILVIQIASRQVYGVITALEHSDSRKEQEKSYASCVKCLKKHAFLVKYNKTIGGLQLLLVAAAFVGALLLSMSV